MKKDPLKIALFFLKFRPRSVFEIEKKLKEKKISEKEIAETIRVLKRNGLLDDAEFAKMWVRDRNRFKPSGSYVLKMELKKLGLPETDIDNALSEQDEEVLARQAIESKHRYREARLGSQGDADARRADFAKQAQFLQRRGFRMNIIMKILKK